MLRYIRDADAPVVSTTDIAEEFDYSTAHTRRRLVELQQCGLVDCRYIGPARAWWLTRAGRIYISRGADDR